MKHRNKRRRKRYLGTDKTIRISKDNHDRSHVHGALVDAKHTKWKYGVIKTMEELFSKGVLNQYHIDKLAERGIDLEEITLKHQLSELDMDRTEDLIKLATLAKKYPDAIKMMSKIEKNRYNARMRGERRTLEDKLRELDLDKPEDVMVFAGIVKENPEAMDIMTKIMEEAS